MSTLTRSSFVIGVAAAGAALPLAAAGQTAHLTVANAPIDSGMTPIVAQRAGFYRKYGLDVQLVTMNSGAAVSAAVAGGSLQIGSSSLPGVIAAHSKGVPFQLVHAGLGVRVRSPLRRAARARGRPDP